MADVESVMKTARLPARQAVATSQRALSRQTTRGPSSPTWPTTPRCPARKRDC